MVQNQDRDQCETVETKTETKTTKNRSRDLTALVKLLIQGRNNITREWLESKSCDQGRRKNDAFTHSTTFHSVRNRNKK